MSTRSPLRSVSFWTTTPVMLVIDVDDDFLDRLELDAVLFLHHDARAADGQLEAFAAHVLDQHGELQVRRGRRLRTNRCRSPSVILMATLPSASRSRRSRMTRDCTLSPSRPASGPSLMRKVTDRVGGSIGLDGSGSVTEGWPACRQRSRSRDRQWRRCRRLRPHRPACARGRGRPAPWRRGPFRLPCRHG